MCEEAAQLSKTKHSRRRWSSMLEEADGVAVAAQPSLASRGNRIKKRALRNKSLSITFNEKDLKDYVGGFHKRKKKRRKEAQKKQEKVERRKRIEDRKRRRLEREYAVHGGAPPASDAESNGEDLEEEDNENEVNPSVSGTTTYEHGDVMVTVTTSEITHEEDEEHLRGEKSTSPFSPPLLSKGTGKKRNVPVSKKKPFKKASKGKSRPRLSSKRDRKKGKKRKN